MALDYNESAQLRINQVFQGRVASASLKWAAYIFDGTIQAGNSLDRRKLAYAQDVYQNPTMKANQLQPTVVQDQGIQAADLDPKTGDSTADDATVQTATERAIEKFL